MRMETVEYISNTLLVHKSITNQYDLAVCTISFTVHLFTSFAGLDQAKACILLPTEEGLKRCFKVPELLSQILTSPSSPATARDAPSPEKEHTSQCTAIANHVVEETKKTKMILEACF